MNSNLIILLSIFCANINCQTEDNDKGLDSDAELRKPMPVPLRCSDIIPENIAPIEITPKVLINMTGNSVYSCDSSSTVKQITSISTGEDTTSCYGIEVLTSDGVSYDAVLRKNNRDVELTMNNYTYVYTTTNANFFYVECGTIVGGPCNGDTLWGSGTWQADDQEGCARNGVSAVSGLARVIEIIGKCQSKCSLGYSLITYANPINNNGIVQRN